MARIFEVVVSCSDRAKTYIQKKTQRGNSAEKYHQCDVTA